MMKRCLVCALLFLATFSGNTQNLNPKFGPWLQNVTETSFTVCWTTRDRVLAWVDIAPDDGTNFYLKERPKFYQDKAGRHLEGTYHCIEVTGLEPGTSYRYRLAGQVVEDDSTNAQAVNYSAYKAYKRYFTVKTLDHNADRCKFSVVNDIHANDEMYKSLTSGLDPKSIDFFVLNGDIVSVTKKIDTLIKHTFSPISEIAAFCPVFYARGNHEGRGADWYKVPEVFPSSSGELYYSFRQGPCAFLVLDAGEDKPDSDVEYSGSAAFDAYRAKELEWLKKAVQDPVFVSAPQKICIIHIPTFNEHNVMYTQKWIYDNFTPILNEAGVKLMLSGHHHKYILKEPGTYDNKYTIYVNSNQERLDVTADASHIHLRSYTADGVLAHSLDL